MSFQKDTSSPQPARERPRREISHNYSSPAWHEPGPSNFQLRAQAYNRPTNIDRGRGYGSVVLEPLRRGTPRRSPPIRKPSPSAPRFYNTGTSPYPSNHITRSPTPPFKLGTPSDFYFAQSIVPSMRLVSPSRKLLVLDLNGTLVFRPPVRRPAGERRIHPRPYMRAFAQFIARHPTIQAMVWSSARSHNVKKMVDAAFGNSPEGQCSLTHIWARDTLGLSESEFG